MPGMRRASGRQGAARRHTWRHGSASTASVARSKSNIVALGDFPRTRVKLWRLRAAHLHRPQPSGQLRHHPTTKM
eukprot:2878732-Prymnesium_polylepis.1